MENINDKPAATAESFWAALHAYNESLAETKRSFTERLAETERILTAGQAETNRQMAETSRKMAETDRQMAETDRLIKEVGEQQKKTDRQMAKTDRQISRLEEQLGGISNSNGLFAEDYFSNSLSKGENTFFGEKFDKLIKSVVAKDDNNNIKGEFDILLINGKSVAIIEVKYRAREKHIDNILKKIIPFRRIFPEYQNHKVFFGLASLSFDESIEDKCKENGIAVIKQVGDTVVIYDENLKTF
jgi:hypothetical protein